jgi:protein tyrosine/serine phosphatase
VSDTLYRGAQPEDEGWAELRKMGIRTVVNLRLTHSDRDETEEHGPGYERISMEAWDADYDELVEFLQVVTDPEKQPVFVHCHHGADRTGLSVAAYRMAVQGWTAEEAVREMRDGGYGFHHIWGNLPRYLEELDVDQLRRDAGIEPEAGG